MGAHLPVSWMGKLARPQFTLRGGFAFVALIAALAAWQGSRYRQSQAQERAFARIAELGGTILVYTEGAYIEFTDPSKPLVIDCGTGLERVIRPTATGREIRIQDVRFFKEITKLYSVNLKDGKITPDALKQLREVLPGPRLIEP